MTKKSYLIYGIILVLMISCGKKQSPPKLSLGTDDYGSYGEESTNIVSSQHPNNDNQTSGSINNDQNIPQLI